MTSMGLAWAMCLLTRHGLKCDGCKAESDGRWHEKVFVTLLERQLAVGADEGERSRGDCIRAEFGKHLCKLGGDGNLKG